MRERLRPGGVVYVSYNCLPGGAPILPLRRLMTEVRKAHPGRSDQQLALALDLLTKLKPAAYFAANPAAAAHFDDMLGKDPTYLVHEYLSEASALFSFADVAALMTPAGVAYAASATLTDNIAVAVQDTLRPLVAQTRDPVLRETLRDFATNKGFRRDIFARDSTVLPPAEWRRALSGYRFALAVPRSRLTFRFAGPVGELLGHDDLYGPLADALSHQPASFDALLALPLFGEARIDLLVECLALLAHSDQVLPLAGPAPDAAPARRFNRMIAHRAREGRAYGYLAAPVARTGIAVSEADLRALAAAFDGKGDDIGEAFFPLWRDLGVL